MELKNNVICRIALDGATADNGGLYVLPRSHRENYGGNENILARFADQKGQIASQPPGSALFYRPLLLHRSEKSRSDKRRRILHLSFGPADLTLPGAELYPWPQPIPLSPLDDLCPA
jgi:ectoine hydroxylase-related dioxygenase (phytanoyl-CoA dioxygenase family)